MTALPGKNSSGRPPQSCTYKAGDLLPLSPQIGSSFLPLPALETACMEDASGTGESRLRHMSACAAVGTSLTCAVIRHTIRQTHLQATCCSSLTTEKHEVILKLWQTQAQDFPRRARLLWRSVLSLYPTTWWPCIGTLFAALAISRAIHIHSHKSISPFALR